MKELFFYKIQKNIEIKIYLKNYIFLLYICILLYLLTTACTMRTVKTRNIALLPQLCGKEFFQRNGNSSRSSNNIFSSAWFSWYPVASFLFSRLRACRTNATCGGRWAADNVTRREDEKRLLRIRSRALLRASYRGRTTGPVRYRVSKVASDIRRIRLRQNTRAAFLVEVGSRKAFRQNLSDFLSAPSTRLNSTRQRTIL